MDKKKRIILVCIVLVVVLALVRAYNKFNLDSGPKDSYYDEIHYDDVDVPTAKPSFLIDDYDVVLDKDDDEDI